MNKDVKKRVHMYLATVPMGLGKARRPAGIRKVLVEAWFPDPTYVTPVGEKGESHPWRKALAKGRNYCYCPTEEEAKKWLEAAMCARVDKAQRDLNARRKELEGWWEVCDAD